MSSRSLWSNIARRWNKIIGYDAAIHKLNARNIVYCIVAHVKVSLIEDDGIGKPLALSNRVYCIFIVKAGNNILTLSLVSSSIFSKSAHIFST